MRKRNDGEGRPGSLIPCAQLDNDKICFVVVQRGASTEVVGKYILVKRGTENTVSAKEAQLKVIPTKTEDSNHAFLVLWRAS